jgi:hypothetical protein
LISAVVVFATDKSKPEAIWASLIPLGLFLVLDAYYLGLERKFRALYNEFVGKLHNEEVILADIFSMKPPNTPNTLIETGKAIISISVWPFYILIAVLLIVLKSWIF